MPAQVGNANKDILRQCRIQIGLELSQVEKTVSKIQLIEQGDQKPTFIQLDALSKLYKVPRWVFISEELPDKYKLDSAIPAFRKFDHSNAEVFSDAKIRGLTAQVERFRELILELRDDMGEPILPFSAPKPAQNAKPDISANLLMSWLNVKGKRFEFLEWRKIVEDKGVFIFMTSKYKGWSHIDRDLLRGFTIHHNTLPIIVINDSDASKAQTFTLFHELGHIMKKESTIDDWTHRQKEDERWCDEMAGNLLMPSEEFKAAVSGPLDLDIIKKIGRNFKVSAYACLVRLRQLEIIDQPTYDKFEAQLIDEFRQLQKKLKEADAGASRNRPKEVLNQYGRIFVTTLFQAYHNKDIGFHRLSQFLNLKKPSHVLEMEEHL
jgi:Zn-dependent peptidase ImmA (M78 family)